MIHVLKVRIRNAQKEYNERKHLVKENLLNQKKKLLEKLKLSGFITRENVIQAFLKVPREEFLPENLKEKAYIDHPLPIPGGQTISAPHKKQNPAFLGETCAS